MPYNVCIVPAYLTFVMFLCFGFLSKDGNRDFSCDSEKFIYLSHFVPIRRVKVRFLGTEALKYLSHERFQFSSTSRLRGGEVFPKISKNLKDT